MQQTCIFSCSAAVALQRNIARRPVCGPHIARHHAAWQRAARHAAVASTSREHHRHCGGVRPAASHVRIALPQPHVSCAWAGRPCAPTRMTAAGQSSADRPQGCRMPCGRVCHWAAAVVAAVPLDQGPARALFLACTLLRARALASDSSLLQATEPDRGSCIPATAVGCSRGVRKRRHWAAVHLSRRFKATCSAPRQHGTQVCFSFSSGRTAALCSGLDCFRADAAKITAVGKNCCGRAGLGSASIRTRELLGTRLQCSARCSQNIPWLA